MSKSIGTILPGLIPAAGGGAELIPWDLSAPPTPINPVYDPSYALNGTVANGSSSGARLTATLTGSASTAKGDLGAIPASGKFSFYARGDASAGITAPAKETLVVIQPDGTAQAGATDSFVVYLRPSANDGLHLVEQISGTPTQIPLDPAFELGQVALLHFDLDAKTVTAETPNGVFGPVSYTLDIQTWDAFALAYLGGGQAGEEVYIDATSETDLGSGFTPIAGYPLLLLAEGDGLLPDPLPENGSILYCTQPGTWKGKEYKASVSGKIDGAILVDNVTGDVIPLSDTGILNEIISQVEAGTAFKAAHELDYTDYDDQNIQMLSMDEGTVVIINDVEDAVLGSLPEVEVHLDVGNILQAKIIHVMFRSSFSFGKTVPIRIRAFSGGTNYGSFVVDNITEATAYTLLAAPGQLTYLLNKHVGHASSLVSDKKDIRDNYPFEKNSIIQQQWPRPSSMQYGWHILNKDHNSRRVIQTGTGSFPEALKIVTDKFGENYAVLTATNVLLSFRGIGQQTPVGIPITDPSKVLMEFSADGKWFYVANTTANKLEVYDIENGSAFTPDFTNNFTTDAVLTGDILALCVGNFVSSDFIVVGDFNIAAAGTTIQGIKLNESDFLFDGGLPYPVASRATGYNLGKIHANSTYLTIVADDGAGNNVVLSGAISTSGGAQFDVAINTTDIIHDAKFTNTYYLGGQRHIMILMEEVATGDVRLLRKNATGSFTYGDLLIEAAAAGAHTSFEYSEDGQYIAMPSGVLVDNYTLELLNNHRVTTGALAFF